MGGVVIYLVGGDKFSHTSKKQDSLDQKSAADNFKFSAERLSENAETILLVIQLDGHAFT